MYALDSTDTLTSLEIDGPVEEETERGDGLDEGGCKADKSSRVGHQRERDCRMLDDLGGDVSAGVRGRGKTYIFLKEEP